MNVAEMVRDIWSRRTIAGARAELLAQNRTLARGQIACDEIGAKIGDGTTPLSRLPHLLPIVPYAAHAGTSGIATYRPAFPQFCGSAASQTALREYWMLLSWAYSQPATVIAVDVTTEVASSSIILGRYEMLEDGSRGTRLDRAVLSSASPGFKEATLLQPWLPGRWYWVSIFTEAAVTLIAQNGGASSLQLLPLGVAASGGAINGHFRATDVANAAPSTAPANSALSASNAALPTILLRP